MSLEPQPQQLQVALRLCALHMHPQHHLASSRLITRCERCMCWNEWNQDHAPLGSGAGEALGGLLMGEACGTAAGAALTGDAR